MAKLVITLASLHGPSANKGKQTLQKALVGNSVGFTEAYGSRTRKWWTGRPHWRHTPDNPGRSHAYRSATEVPILTKKARPDLGMGTVQISDPTSNLRVGPARFLSFSLFNHPFGRIAHINTHPNAGVMSGKNKGLIREYAKSMEALEAWIALFQRAGFLVVVTMDGNYAEPKHAPHWAPARVFRRRKMAWWRVGVDWIAYDKKLKPWRKRIIPARSNGGDHPWLRIWLDKRR